MHMSSRSVDLSSPDVSVSLVGDGTDRLGDHVVMFLDDKVSVFAEGCWTTVLNPAECATLLIVVIAYDGTDRDSNHLSWPWMTLIPLCQVDLEQLGSFRPTFVTCTNKCATYSHILPYSQLFHCNLLMKQSPPVSCACQLFSGDKTRAYPYILLVL